MFTGLGQSPSNLDFVLTRKASPVQQNLVGTHCVRATQTACWRSNQQDNALTPAPHSSVSVTEPLVGSAQQIGSVFQGLHDLPRAVAKSV